MLLGKYIVVELELILASDSQPVPAILNNVHFPEDLKILNEKEKIKKKASPS